MDGDDRKIDEVADRGKLDKIIARKEIGDIAARKESTGIPGESPTSPVGRIDLETDFEGTTAVGVHGRDGRIILACNKIRRALRHQGGHLVWDYKVARNRAELDGIIDIRRKAGRGGSTVAPGQFP